jgi:23S rRNA (adenine2503-C2)-methyltransferase
MLEITLIDGLNDSIIEAQELAFFANRIKERVDGIKLVVNLIPFNDIGYEQYNRAKPENVAAFQKVLIENGVQTYIRTTRGDEEHSACGQLATKKRKILES